MPEPVNLTIEKDTKKKVLKVDPAEIPDFKTHIDLSPEDKERIFKEIDAELTEIKKERSDMKLDEELDALDQQYDGKMREIANMQFNVSKKTTAIKINAVERALMEAFFEGDHVFSVSPRPEFDADNGREVTEKQEDFLDYKIDEVIPLEEEMAKVMHHACLKKGGVLKLTQKYKVKHKKTDETYDGKWTVVTDQRGRPVLDEQKKQKMENKGLEAFIKAYPTAPEDYPKHVQALAEGKTLNLVIEYDEVVYDDPLPKAIDMKNFFVRKNVNGIDGLRDTYLVAERKEYTYWELLQEEKEERLYDIDKLITSEDVDGKRQPIENFANQKYELLECVFHTKVEGSDEYNRCVFHANIEKKSIHSSDYYPYWAVDTYYIPFYVNERESGFYRKGLGEDLRDLHIAQNILLCLALEAAYNAALVTPIIQENSPALEQFIENDWTCGKPLIVRGKGDIPDFLNKYYRPPEVMQLMNLIAILGQEGGDIIGVSDAWATGKADPMDPSAPAQKTRDLLRQAGVNLRDYIKTFGRSFNEVGNVLMQMYYQRNQQSYKYRRSRAGDREFKEISRADMAAKTNFQTQAMAFDVDKLNAKREDLALWQVIRGEPIFAGNEEAVYYGLKMLVKNWSPKWKNNIDKILPNMQEFKKKRLMVAVQAVQVYMQQLQAQTQLTGEPAKVDVKGLMAVMNKMIQEIATPPPKEVQEERAKNAQA